MFKIPEPVQRNQTDRLRYVVLSKTAIRSQRAMQKKSMRMVMPSLMSAVATLSAGLVVAQYLLT